MSNIETRRNATQEGINEFVELGDGLIAHRYNIIATSSVGYDVYERSTYSGMRHSSFLGTKEYGCLGDITTRRLPSSIDALPAWSDERSQAVKTWYRDLEAMAERCIHEAFPKDFEEHADEGFSIGQQVYERDTLAPGVITDIDEDGIATVLFSNGSTDGVSLEHLTTQH